MAEWETDPDLLEACDILFGGPDMRCVAYYGNVPVFEVEELKFDDRQAA